MSNDNCQHSCHFEWEIHHPFTPWHRLNATFYDGSLPATRWKVTLKPLMRRINFWKFALSLQLDPTFQERDKIVVNRLQVEVFLNNGLVHARVDSNILLQPRNFHAYRFETEVIKSNSRDSNVLLISIAIHLPGTPPADEFERNDDDPRCLSEDLRRLLNNPFYSNMRVQSSDGNIYKVHSYILHVRWNNLFTLHAFNAANNAAVKTDISGVLLTDILIYIYSGVLNFGLKHWANPSCIVELFHVIHLYKLYHLYKVILKDDLHQKRSTSRNELTETYIFPLQSVLGHPNDSSSRSWSLNPNTPCELLFTIRVQSTHGPWLSYSLQSRSEFPVYAQVDLEIKKVVETPGIETQTSPHTIFVHQCDYTIHPTKVADSGAVLFLGCPQTFRDFSPVDRQSREFKYFVRCTLKFSDGGTIDLIQSIDNMFQNYLERFNLLGDNFHKLRRNRLQSDLRVVPRFNPDDRACDPQEIHKAIFRARVPRWWRLVEDLEPTDEMPNEVVTFLANDAMPFVLDYIYTSRVFFLPHDFLEEIVLYAGHSGFISLLNLATRICKSDAYKPSVDEYPSIWEN